MKIDQKFYQTFYAIKSFFCIYKRYLISTGGYKNAGADLLRVKRNRWNVGKMKDVGDGLAVQNFSDLVLKEIYSIYRTKTFQKSKLKYTKWLKEKFSKNMII